MLAVTLIEEEGIAILEPDGELTKSDFLNVASTIDPYIEDLGGLAGIIISVEKFPGWDSFGSLVTHLRFVRDHHYKIARVAFATDSPIGKLAEHVASHFVNAEIKSFPYEQLSAAQEWVAAG